MPIEGRDRENSEIVTSTTTTTTSVVVRRRRSCRRRRRAAAASSSAGGVRGRTSSRCGCCGATTTAAIVAIVASVSPLLSESYLAVHPPQSSSSSARTAASSRPRRRSRPSSDRRDATTTTTTTTSLDAAAAAASAWLFTPDRTSSVLVERSADAISGAAAVAATSALGAAADFVATSETIIYRAPFVSLAVSFLLGGLFFSTLAAIVGGVVALGRENTRRAREVFMIVLRRNWSVVMISMQFTMDVLRGKEKMSGFKNRFPAALQALRDGVAEVKRVFTESVDAIKKETQMYSAAIGLPGLIPIQYIFDRIFPSMLTAPFESALQDALLQTARDNPQIERLVLRKFTMGGVAPRLLEARLFDLGDRDMAFDLEMSWKSEARADIDLRVSSFGTKIPVTIQNLRFEGPVRLILVGLRKEEPGWEAMLISLPRPPQIGFDVKVAGGLITQIPWLQSYFAKMLDKSVADEVLWPRRAVVSAPAPFKAKPLLNPMQILSLMRDDPLLRMERELMASIPDDFRSSLESPSSMNDGVPTFDIRQVNGDGGARGYDGEGMNGGGGAEYDDDDDDDDDDDGGKGWGVPLLGRMRFWRRRERSSAMEAAVAPVDAVQLMAQYLRQEARNVGSNSKMPAMILVGVDERRTLARRALREVLLPRSILSYVGREGGI